MQLIAGRMAQEYNRRKERKGAYWEDRYHATAVETDRHLIRCMVYMDLNMVRAGVVKHPSGWPESGYNEIQEPPRRYAIVDQEGLKELLNYRSRSELAVAYRGWIDEALSSALCRERRWTESVAVGSELFVHTTQAKLGIKGNGREVVGADGSYELREVMAAYSVNSGHENASLRLQNGYFWDDPDEMSAT
jgi:REP-associated tyrosine transposase